MEKKYLFKEISKEMGYTALKTNIAVLNKPYDNEYLNKNFTLNMLTPVEGKEHIYKAYMNKMISNSTSDGKIYYKDLGMTVVSPDYEHIKRIKEVADSFNINSYIIDPIDKSSIGLNPFIIENPALCGLVISGILFSLYNPSTHTAELAYMYDLSQQAIQNIVLLMKLIYPKLHDGLMPNLEDLLKCFTNFDLIQEMCENLEQSEELAKEYELQIDYFKRFFYKGCKGYDEMQRYIHFPAAQLDVLLRSGEAKAIICNRYNNIDFTDVIENGSVVLFCSRPFEVGGIVEQSFTRFFLTLMMCSVEIPRATTEKTRTPHFLYIDEFDRYADNSFEDIITIYRKYRIGTIFSVQNLSRLAGGIGSSFSQTLLSNSATKITFGNSTPEEMNWWMQEFGKRKEWKVGYSYDKQEGEYSDKLGGPSWDWTDHMKLGKIQGLKFKAVIYKIKNNKGKNVVNFGTVDFLESKYKTPHKSKTYNFNKYIINISDDKKDSEPKWKPNKVTFSKDERGDIDPVQTDTTDSSFFFDNENAISFNLNGNSSENDNK
ncbi:MAG: type IV secretory system conjugative DNA transfer family protein [Clostridia bacterium]|nr:type IV secretory system conjugative DNA transfer family protein [Clostridia bacterium]